MDAGNYQYSHYETSAEFDSRVNAYSSGQQQQQQQPSQNVMSQQSGMFSQQSGMLPQQPGMMSQQTGMMGQQTGMSQQWGAVSNQTGTMLQQSGMMSQQSGMMSQQSGTMSQQSGVMSQQSGMWSNPNLGDGMWNAPNSNDGMWNTNSSDGMWNTNSSDGMWNAPNSSDMQQSSSMWMPPQSDGVMSGSSNMSYSQQNFNNFNKLDSYSISQQSGNMGPPAASEGYSTGQKRTDSQQFSSVSQQPMASYNQGGSRLQQGGNNMNYSQESYQGTDNASSFQQRKSNPTYPQDNSFGQQNQAGNSFAYQQDSFRNNNHPSFDQGGPNVTNQQRNTAPQYPQNNTRSPANPPNAGYQQGNRASLQSNARNRTDSHDPLDSFYSEIGHAAGDDNSQHTVPGHSGKQSKSSEFEDDDTEYCKLCNVYFTSAPMYAFHVRGLAHAQRLMAVEAGQDRRAAEKPFIVSGKNYTQTVPQEPVNGGKQSESHQSGDDLNAGCYCEVCDIHVNNERMLWRHYQGKKHLKALKALERGEIQLKPATHRPVDPNIERASVLMNTRVPDQEVSSLNFAFDSVPEDEPIVGLGFLVETMENMNQVIECELCRTKGNLYNMVQHVLGLKHRLQYLKVRDRERYDAINKSEKKPVQSEDARLMCEELEKMEGRGTARYNGPPRRMPREHERRLLGRGATPPPAHLLRYREQQHVMSESEKRIAIESLKRTLLDDFHKRNIDPDTATKILNSRMELLAEYEKRGVPFVVARERVIEEEERWNLLLEFERQVLSFDEAEQRIDHRFELMKMYEQKGFPREDARRKVLDDEVIYDFKRDFVRLGLQREQAQKLAERRLWMLEHLHLQGLTPEDASKKVVVVEQELKKFLKAMFEEDRRGRSRESQTAQWMIAGEELERYIMKSCRELGLSADVTEDQVSFALEAFDRYRMQRIPADEAKCRVLVDDLPIPRQPVDAFPADVETESANDPGSRTDITNRVNQFKSKISATMEAGTEDCSEEKEKEADQEEAEVDDQEKKLADYDQQSRLEIQNLLADMLKMKIPADEARRRLVALYKQHESLRENLFPAKKLSSSTARSNKPSASEKSKKPDDASAKDETSEEKSATEPPSEEMQTAKSDSSATKDTMEGSGKEVEGKEEKNNKVMSTGEDKPECSDGVQSGVTSGQSSETKKSTTANDRWNASVEMFLQQYGLSRDEYRSQISKRRSSGHDRYSPSDLSPLRSRSRSPDRSRRSPGSRREGAGHSSHDRGFDRGDRRRRSRSRSSSRWSQMLKSRIESTSPYNHHRSSFTPGYRGRLRSGEREWDPRGPRRSPGRWSPRRRSPGRRSPPFPRSHRPRFSPGRRSPRPRFSPDRRSPPRRRSPSGRWSPMGRRSPYSRGHSPERQWSPAGHGWGRPADFCRYPSGGRRSGRSRSRERPRWERRESPLREPEFNFADGVWPDVDDPWD